MKILFVVQSLIGDRIDANHFRVEHHHAEGLTYTNCLIDGVVREVRATSRLSRNHPITMKRTILVHLKPLPRPMELLLQCAHIPTHQILMSVERGNVWPSLSDYRRFLSLPNFSSLRLIERKQRNLVRKGYLILDTGVPFLTDKGRRYLEQANAGT